MSKGTRQLNRAATASKGVQRRVVRGVQKYGRVEHKKLAALYSRQRFYVAGTNRQGGFPPISIGWRRTKRRLGLSLVSGKASGATLKAARSSASFIRTKDGFTISWPRANMLAKSPRKGYGPQRVASYFRFFNARAGGSLGKLSPAQRNRVVKAAAADERKRMRRKIPNAKLRGSTLDMVVKVDGFRLPLRGV